MAEMSKADQAEALFMSGRNCAQAVLGAFADGFGLDAETAAKVACGLGGGVGRLREVCGAVSGAAMALGLKYGSDKAVVYPKVQALAERFRAEAGSIVCRELLEGTQATTGGQSEARTPEYYRKRPCVELVRLAARLLETEAEAK